MGCQMQQPVIPALPIGAGQKVVWAGDSLTEGYRVPPGTPDATYSYVIPLQASIVAAFTAAAQTLPTFQNTAISGQISAAVLAGVNAQIITPAPAHVVLNIATNDLSLGNISPATVNSNIRQIIIATLAALPNCKFHIVSIPGGEYWPYGADPQDVARTAMNTAIRDAAYAYDRSAEFIDIRPGILAWEAANNPTHLTQGLLTQDGTHPTKTGDRPAGQSGAEVWSSLVYSQLSLTVPK